MREPANASATSAGTCAFIAQVRSSWPEEPNLRPAMNTTLASFGSASTCRRSRRSAAMHSMPPAASCSRRPGSLKRATPTTRLPGAARLASRAKVGPILPPTPRMMRSPASCPSSAAKAADGVVITSSRCSTSRKRSGSAAEDAGIQRFLNRPATAPRHRVAPDIGEPENIRPQNGFVPDDHATTPPPVCRWVGKLAHARGGSIR